jgi:type VI secretion system protein VasJ
MDLRSLGTTPVDPQHPAGVDVRYDPVFEALQAQVDKLSLPSAVGAVDWEKVSQLAATILGEKSKDLLVACYFCVAQIHLAKADGLDIGLQVVCDLLSQFWDDLFPLKKRMRGRIAALQWWIDRTQLALQPVGLEPLQPELTRRIQANLEKIDLLLKQQLPDPPALGAVKRMIASLKSAGSPPGQQKPSEKTEPAPDGHQPTSAAIEAAQGPIDIHPPPQPPAAKPTESQDSAVPATGQDPFQEVSQLMTGLRKISSAIMASEKTHPLAYRCRRIAAWTEIAAAPRQRDGLTDLSSPPTSTMSELAGMSQEKAWEDLLNLAEDSLSRNAFWIDANRYSAQALAGLGEGFEKARHAVCRETACFVQRLAGIERLKFADGVPFADQATLQWLGQIGLQRKEVSTTPAITLGADPSDGAGDRIRKFLQEAQTLADGQHLPQAIAALKNALSHCPANKDAHMCRLAMCRLLLNANEPRLARPHLDLILEDIDRHGLESWDPDVALNGLKMIWEACRGFSEGPAREKAEQMLKRIARLDPTEAFRLDV